MTLAKLNSPWEMLGSGSRRLKIAEQWRISGRKLHQPAIMLQWQKIAAAAARFEKQRHGSVKRWQRRGSGRAIGLKKIAVGARRQKRCWAEAGKDCSRGAAEARWAAAGKDRSRGAAEAGFEQRACLNVAGSKLRGGPLVQQ